MLKFSTAREPLFNPFVRHRIVSDRWNEFDEKRLASFDHFCTVQYPEINGLSQEMVDTWCRKRDTEKNGSCFRRTYIIVALVRYLQDRGVADVQVPIIPKDEKRAYIPHAFAPKELDRFFQACDRLSLPAPVGEKAARAIIASAIFRLLYSSGLRTVEARLLRTDNVDLNHGVLDIQYSKGRDQHYIVLHDSMLIVLRNYDAAIQKIYPGRLYFFPGSSKEPLYREWIPMTFRKLWDSVNNTHAVAYDLRHNYATTNINHWVGDGMAFLDKFVYLSKSMGHKSLQSTRYYYSIVPVLSDVLEDKTSGGFNEIVPEVCFDV